MDLRVHRPEALAVAVQAREAGYYHAQALGSPQKSGFWELLFSIFSGFVAELLIKLSTNCLQTLNILKTLRKIEK